MADKNEILSEELYNDFESFTILTAIDHLDEMRRHLADRVNFEPPQIRNDLMNLHEMVMDVSNGSSEYSIEDISEQLWDIESKITAIQEAADKLLNIFSDLDNVLNTVSNRLEEE